MASAIQQFLMSHRGRKGGVAGGKPYMTGQAAGHPVMNLSPVQALAPHTLSALLAAQGPAAESHVKRQMSDAQQQRLAIRRQELQQAGYDPNTPVYGPNANLQARHALEGGSGLGAGLGLARATPHARPHTGEVHPAGLAGLLRQVALASRRRRGGGASGGSG